MAMLKLKWISISTEIFNDEKIDLIRAQSNGSKYFEVWIGLICLAGKNCDGGGGLWMFNGLPYDIISLARHLKVDADTLRTALDLFESLEMISRAEGGVIEIINFQKYHPIDRLEKLERFEEQGRLRQKNFKARQKQKQLIDNTKDIKTKDINNNRQVTLPTNVTDNVIETFALFWSAYPRRKGTKTGKQAALKAWVKITPDDDMVDTIINSVEDHKSLDDWQKDDGQFIPMASTFLNQRRWEDELNIKSRKDTWKSE